MSKKLKTIGAIMKVTKEVGKAGEIAKVSVVLPGAEASNIPLGNVIITIETTQKEITFGNPIDDEDEK